MEGPPSDATLLAGVAERDIGALRALYERHAGWLALRLARRCNDHELLARAPPAGAMTMSWWRTPSRTRSSRSGRSRGASAVMATSRRGCGASRSVGWSVTCAAG